MPKKAQGLRLNFIVIAAIAALVLVVIIALTMGGLGNFFNKITNKYPVNDTPENNGVEITFGQIIPLSDGTIAEWQNNSIQELIWECGAPRIPWYSPELAVLENQTDEKHPLVCRTLKVPTVTIIKGQSCWSEGGIDEFGEEFREYRECCVGADCYIIKKVTYTTCICNLVKVRNV